METSPLGQEWEDQFSILECDQAQLHHVYLTLLALATSENDLRALHARLPDNCQMLPDDLASFVSFWRTQVSVSDLRGVRILSAESVSRILAMHCQDTSLSWYYTEKLLAARPTDETILRIYTRGTNVQSWENIRDGSSGTFSVEIQGVACSTCCSLSEDTQDLIVRISVPIAALTAVTTQQFLSLPRSPYYSRLDGEVPYFFRIDADVFVRGLFATGPLSPLPSQEHYVTAEMLDQAHYRARVSSGFYDQIVRSLNAVGVPATSATRTMTFDENVWQSHIKNFGTVLR